MSKTFEQEEVDALVQSAVAKQTEELRRELDDLKNSEETKAVEARIAEARAEGEAKVTDLQARLDESVITAEAATKDKDEILAWLESEKEAAAQQAALEERRGARVEQVAAVASFPEEYVKENADRWASLEDEAFASLLVDYKTVAEKAAAGKQESGSTIPTQTAMQAARENDGGNKGGAYREVFALRERGVDLRSI